MAIDPTRTKTLRGEFRAEAERRLRVVLNITRIGLVEQDMLGLGGPVTDVRFFPQAPMTNHLKLMAFGDWFNAVCYNYLVGRAGDWSTDFVQRAYDRGAAAANVDLGQQAPLHPFNSTLGLMALNELSGIADALVQKVGRTVADALAKKAGASALMASINAQATAIVPRLQAACNVLTVRTFNEAKLDTYAQAGLMRVGIIPEHKPRMIGRDARPTMRRYRGASWRVDVPEEELDFPEMVNVLTAGDNLVCDRCDEISANGPYDIDAARGLIPAHPNCRCAFTPAFDLRFASEEEWT